MTKFEKVCISESPDIVFVPGDTNTALACSLVVSKFNNIKLAHTDAGGRSFDKNIPEEVNRIVSDSLSDYLFPMVNEHYDNLIKEGYNKSKIFLVGDLMVDNLLYYINEVQPLLNEKYMLVTIHRQSNTDNKQNLQNILKSIDYLTKKIQVVFPIHPRTIKQINLFGLNKYLNNVDVLPPLSYLKFLSYLKYADIVLTDSGGLQIETTILGVPCLTARNVVERYFTLSEGTNILVGNNKNKIISEFENIISGNKKFTIKKDFMWDGKVSERIIQILL